MNNRYKVVPYSQSGHCCFESTVVDTSKPTYFSESRKEQQYKEVCECFDDDLANLICEALNNYVASK